MLLTRGILLMILKDKCNAWNISSQSTKSKWFMPWHHWIETVSFLKWQLHGSLNKATQIAEFHSWNVSWPCGSYDDEFSSPHLHSLWKDIILVTYTLLASSPFRRNPLPLSAAFLRTWLWKGPIHDVFSLQRPAVVAETQVKLCLCAQFRVIEVHQALTQMGKKWEFVEQLSNLL